MTPTERREKLLEWMREYGPNSWRNQGTMSEVVRMSGFYAKPHHAGFRWTPGWNRALAVARRDLTALEEEGKVRRLSGRPARWEVV